MKIGKLSLLMILGIIVFTSCDNNDDNNLVQIPNGNYTGTFTVEYTNGDTFSNPVTVGFIEENVYDSNDNLDYYPAGGNGTFEINASTIEFNDVGVWTANFDWNLILNGVYDFSLNGNELVISANKNDVGFYKYELIKE